MLDNLVDIRKVDTGNMLGLIYSFPDTARKPLKLLESPFVAFAWATS